MSLYIVRNGAPTVMRSKGRIASFCLEHAMIFEDSELQLSPIDEYRFLARNGREYYFNTDDVRVVKDK